MRLGRPSVTFTVGRSQACSTGSNGSGAHTVCSELPQHSTPVRTPRDTIIEQLGSSLGLELASELVHRTADFMGCGPDLEPKELTRLLNRLAESPGLIGITARFAKSHAHLDWLSRRHGKSDYECDITACGDADPLRRAEARKPCRQTSIARSEFAPNERSAFPAPGHSEQVQHDRSSRASGAAPGQPARWKSLTSTTSCRRSDERASTREASDSAGA